IIDKKGKYLVNPQFDRINISSVRDWQFSPVFSDYDDGFSADDPLYEDVNTYENTYNQKEKFPVMTFENTEHYFGDIEQGTHVEHLFRFTNTGNAPLIITDV